MTPLPPSQQSRSRIYFTPMPDGQQPSVAVNEPFEAVVGKFNPAIVTTDGHGWPVFTMPDGRRQAFNPDHVDCIVEEPTGEQKPEENR